MSPMMHHHPCHSGSLLAGLLVLLGMPWVAQAQAAPYEVELIVFRQLDHEQPMDPATLPRSPAADGPEALAGLVPLAPEALQLGDIATRLRRSPAYRLVYHGGWQQQVDSQALALPSALPAAAADAGLQGALSFYRERFLHVLVDIRLSAEGEPAGPGWHMRQSRRLRGTALQYFDHPAFGLILAVRRPVGDEDP
ncbi:MAG: hypothetical protein H3C57_05220 [Gammaproteobacteria bacterium]|nr:hypothetical protein [Gammaproteobacteria bacterium]